MTITYNDTTFTYDETNVSYDGVKAHFDGAIITVHAAFGYDPLDTSPIFTDVSQWVRELRIDRGSRSEFALYGVGQATVDLDNRDRRFDPEYTSSPYYGDLNPMVPVKIQVTYSGTVYTLFYGFAQGWPTSYNLSNTDAVTTVKCVDANRLLSNAYLEETAFIYQIVKDGATWHFPLQKLFFEQERMVNYERTGLTNIFCTDENARPQLYEAGLPVGSSLANGTAITGWRSLPGNVIGGSASSGDMPTFKTLEWWFDARTEEMTGTSGCYVTLERNETGRDLRVFLQIRYNGTNFEIPVIEYLSQEEGIGLAYSTPFTVSPITGMNHIALTVYDGNVSVYLNGVSVFSQPLSTTTVGVSSSLFQAVLQGTGFGISNIVAYETGLSATQMAAHYDAGFGNTGELSSARLNRVLDEIGWPSAWRTIETGVQNVGAYYPASLSARDYLSQINDAEQGSLFVNRDGYVEMQSRTTAETVNIVGLFDDQGTDLPYTTIEVDAHTVDAIKNNIVVNYAHGTIEANDTNSITAYGKVTQTVNVNLIDNATDAQAVGDNLLAQSKDPRTRIRYLAVNMRRDISGLVPVVAPLDLYDDIAVSLTPTGVGDPLWRAVTVQGLRHTITRDSWDVNMYLAPSAINTNGALLVLNDDTYGKLDNGNKLG